MEEAEVKEARAVARYVRMSAQKARLVVDAIRGRAYRDAINILTFTRKEAARAIKKVLESAKANLANKKGKRLDEDALYVSKAYVDEGPMLKRFQPVSRGMAHRIRKRTCHITVFVEERSLPEKGVK